MTFNWNRILSGLLASGYVIGAFATGGGEAGFKVLAFVILPVACIWFSEPMGGFTGWSGNIWINAPSPRIFILIVGWVLLILPLLFIVL